MDCPKYSLVNYEVSMNIVEKRMRCTCEENNYRDGYRTPYCRYLVLRAFIADAEEAFKTLE
jgi:hypothetical protein